MAEDQQFCLRWNNFQVNITSQFEALRDEEDFVDVTLACEGQRLKAHKVVLSACSPYFKELFKSNPCKHPILFMRDVEFRHMQALVEFMYAGEVNIAQAQLSAFLKTAESLQIRGLTETPQKSKHESKPENSQSALHFGLNQTVPASSSQSQRINSKHKSGSQQIISSSPEATQDDEILSISPPTSPPPAKRTCKVEQAENSEDSIVQRGHGTSGSKGHEPVEVKCDGPGMIMPKVEIPDYNSDSESKHDNGPMSGNFLGVENSVDISSSFVGIQGGMEIIPGTSAPGFMGDTSQDSAHADHRKLHSLDPRPCPICFRMYSNLSNLRQHLRLIHNPQTVACPLCSKPFKTKLYLKRHLMSFHEMICTNPKTPIIPQNQNSTEFFPPAPQVLLSVTNDNTDDKSDNQNFTIKNKDLSNSLPEYLQNLRNLPNGNEEKTSFFNSNNQDVANKSTTGAVKNNHANFLTSNQSRNIYRLQSNTQKSQDVANFLNSTNSNDVNFTFQQHHGSNDRSQTFTEHNTQLATKNGENFSDPLSGLSNGKQGSEEINESNCVEGN